MEIVDEESLLGRGLMNELDNFSLSALDNVSLASSRPRTFVKQNSVDSNSSGNNSGTQSLSDYSDMDIECQMALLVTTCLNKIKTYSLDGAARMGTPTLDMEVQIQCKYRELGLPDDGMPGARLQERYNTRCSQSTEALTAIQSTIGKVHNLHFIIIFLTLHTIIFEKIIMRHFRIIFDVWCGK